MTPEQFAYWFNGFAELNAEPPTRAQWQAMREHVATVFAKETPPLMTEDGALPRRGLRLDPPAEPESLETLRRVREMQRILRQPLPEGYDTLRPVYPRERRGLRDRLIC